MMFSWPWLSVPSPGSGSPVFPAVTPARSGLRNTPASLYRQAGQYTHTLQKLIIIYDWKSFSFLFASFILDSVTPRVPNVSAILASGGQTPRYTHTPRHTVGSLVRLSNTNRSRFWQHIFFVCVLGSQNHCYMSCIPRKTPRPLHN